MAGIKISSLPAASSANLTDVFPADQTGPLTTRKVSLSQVATLFNTNFVQLAPSGIQTITGFGLVTPAITGGNLEMTGNTLSSTNSNGFINIQSNGTGAYVFGQSGGISPEIFSNGVFSVGVPGTSGGGFRAYDYTADATASNMTFGKSRSTSIGTFAVVQAGDSLGGFTWKADNGAAFTIRSIMAANVTTVGANVGSNLTFSTSNPANVNPTIGMTLSDAQILTLANPLPAGSGGTGSAGGAVLLAPAGTQTITTYGLVLPNLNTTGNVTAGLGAGGSPGSLISFPTTTGKGSLIVAASDNATGSFNTTITNALSYGQSQVVTIPDSGATTAKFILSTGATQTIGAGLSLTTPVIGAASATSIAFTSTSGIIGTTTNNNAAAGSVGELLSTARGVATTSLTSGAAADVLTLSLTAGDWDVWGNISLAGTASTTVAITAGWISLTSVTVPAPNLYVGQYFAGGAYAPFNFVNIGYVPPSIRVSVASTTTVYLSTIVFFAVDVCTAGGQFFARRRR